MSNLFGFLGKRKKNKKQIFPNSQDEEITYQLPKPAQYQNKALKNLPQNVGYSESDELGNYSGIRPNPGPKRGSLVRVCSTPTNKITYLENKGQSINVYSAGIEDNPLIVNRGYIVNESKASNIPLSKNVENITEDRSTIRLQRSEMENFIVDGKENSLPVKTEATRNTHESMSHSRESFTPNVPRRSVAFSENNNQYCSRNSSKYVYNPSYRESNHIPILITDSGRELRPLQHENARRLSMGLKSETDPNRLSVEQTGRTVVARRVSVLVPLSEARHYPAPRRSTRILNPSEGLVQEVQPRKLSVVQRVGQVEEGLETIAFPILNPEHIKVARQSVIKPVMGTEPRKEVRLSTVKLIGINEEIQPGRISVNRPLSGIERFPLYPTQPVIYAVRESNNKPPTRRSLFLKKLFKRKRNDVDEKEAEREIGEHQKVQSVFAVPSTPTRGRTRSVLQQSVKSLTSEKEESPVRWKNIRYSMDTDVFSADVRQRNEKQFSPGYINMERGQGMLVSELLNPITSIFVSDLKNPVPKDPATRPREANVWVKPRQYNTKKSKPSHPRVKIDVAPVATVHNIKLMPKEKPQYRRYESEDDESSSSSSEESNDNRGRRSYSMNRKPTHHRVYAATIPKVNLHDLVYEMKDTSSKNGIQIVESSMAQPLPSTSGLNNDTEGRKQSTLIQPPNVGRISAVEETDIEEALNFLCNPQKIL